MFGLSDLKNNTLEQQTLHSPYLAHKELRSICFHGVVNDSGCIAVLSHKQHAASLKSTMNPER